MSRGKQNRMIIKEALKNEMANEVIRMAKDGDYNELHRQMRDIGEQSYQAGKQIRIWSATAMVATCAVGYLVYDVLSLKEENRKLKKKSKEKADVID